MTTKLNGTEHMYLGQTSESEGDSCSENAKEATYMDVHGEGTESGVLPMSRTVRL